MSLRWFTIKILIRFAIRIESHKKVYEQWRVRTNHYKNEATRPEQFMNRPELTSFKLDITCVTSE